MPVPKLVVPHSTERAATPTTADAIELLSVDIGSAVGTGEHDTSEVTQVNAAAAAIQKRK